MELVQINDRLVVKAEYIVGVKVVETQLYPVAGPKMKWSLVIILDGPDNELVSEFTDWDELVEAKNELLFKLLTPEEEAPMSWRDEPYSFLTDNVFQIAKTTQLSSAASLPKVLVDRGGYIAQASDNIAYSVGTNDLS